MKLNRDGKSLTILLFFQEVKPNKFLVILVVCSVAIGTVTSCIYIKAGPWPCFIRYNGAESLFTSTFFFKK